MGIFAKNPPGGQGDASTPRRGDPGSLSIIAAGASIVGDVVTDGVLKVEGTIDGTVRSGTQLLIAPGAVIRGDVFANELVVGGEIHVSVSAGERVEVQAGALVDGDIRTQRIHIADGGRVNGQVSMEPVAGSRGDSNRFGRPADGVTTTSQPA
jgi:cytoskeletal protein CcmA (bactofilin family)